MKQLNWMAALLLIPSLAFAQQSSDPAADGAVLNESPIGYASVQEAFDALSADENARQSFYQGWTIFNQKVDGKYIIWSFTPENHPVHPSAVRREVIGKDGQIYIGMGVMCHSSRFDCDQLVEQFKEINRNLKRRLSGQAGS